MQPGRHQLLATVSEEQFLQHVIAVAKRGGWWCYHTRDSRHSPSGFPDLVLIRPPWVLYAELKKQDGKVTATQQRVHELLRKCGAEVYVWRPSDEEDIRAVLEGDAHAA